MLQDKNTLFWFKSFLATGTFVLVSMLAERIGFPVSHIFSILFTAIVLTAAMTPLVKRLERLRIPRMLTVFLVYAGFVCLLGLVGSAVVPLVIEQGKGFAATLPTKLPYFLTSVHDFLTRFSPEMAKEFNASVDQFVPKLSMELEGVARDASVKLGALISLSVDSLLVLVIAFFLTVEDNAIHSMIDRFVPADRREGVNAMIDRVIYEMGAWARAQLLLALFFGTAFGTVLWIMGVPYAITIGFVGAVLDIIPYVGGAVAVGLAMIIEFQVDWFWGLMVFAAYFVVMEIEWHVLAPPLMDRYLHLKNVVIVIALAIGATMMGILGALLSLPMAIVLRAVLDYVMPYHGAPNEPPAHPLLRRPIRHSRLRPWRNWIHRRVSSHQQVDVPAAPKTPEAARQPVDTNPADKADHNQGE